MESWIIPSAQHTQALTLPPSSFLGSRPTLTVSAARVQKLFESRHGRPQIIASQLQASRGNANSSAGQLGSTRSRSGRRATSSARAVVGAEAIASSLMKQEQEGRSETSEDEAGVEYRSPPLQLGNPLRFYLPPVPCSTPAKLHPAYHPVREACDTWLVSTLKPQNEAYRQFLVQSMHPLFVCLTMPGALSRHILPLCKMIAWLFVVDNFSDELQLTSAGQDLIMSERDYYDFVLSLLESRSSSSSTPPLQAWNAEMQEMSEVLLHVWGDIQASMSPRQQRRFVAAMRDVFDATLVQNHTREEQGIVDLDTYLSFRKFTGEGYVFMLMAEYGNDLDLDDQVLAHPDIQKLQELVAYHVAYVNDLLSFRKEFCLGHFQNLPSILCVHEGYNMQESIFRLCRMIQGLDDEFVSVKKKVTMNYELMAKDGVATYMDVLGYVMSGFLEWAFQTGRYHGLNNHLTLRSGLVSLVHLDITLISQGYVKSELFAET